MIVYLMRHGDAASPGEWARDDASRPLTPNGERRVETAGRELKRLGFQVGKLLSSPILRARRTAELLAAQLNGLAVNLSDDVKSGVSMETIRKVSVANEASAPLLLIGHMPDLALFAARVAGDPRMIEDGLRTAEIFALETGKLRDAWGGGKLLWRRNPEDLAALTSL